MCETREKCARHEKNVRCGKLCALDEVFCLQEEDDVVMEVVTREYEWTHDSTLPWIVSFLEDPTLQIIVGLTTLCSMHHGIAVKSSGHEVMMVCCATEKDDSTKTQLRTT